MSDPFFPQRVAIIGANLAGARAAEALRQQGYAGELLLVGEEELRPYERPPLSKEALLRADVTPQWVHAENFYAEKGIELITGRSVNALKSAGPRQFELTLSDGSQRQADTVLLTTGGSPRRLTGSDVAQQLVHYVRRWEDTQRLRQAVEPGKRLVVIGSGFIGAEIAATAVGLGCQVTIVEALDRLFPSVPSRAITEAMQAVFLEAGVTAVTGRIVVAITGQEGAVTVHLNDGSTLPAHAVVAGIGIEPRVELAQMVGAGTARGILVNGEFETSVPGIYAAGDVCCIVDADGGQMHIEHWKAAQEQGVAAAHAILGKPATHLSRPWCWSDQLGQRIEAAGCPRTSDEQLIRRISDRELCVFHLRDSQLVGVVTLNSMRSMRMAMKLLGQSDRPNRDHLADASIPINQIQMLAPT